MNRTGRGWTTERRPTINWKREAIDKLKNYEDHREALENIPKEIKRLESAYAGIRSAADDGAPVSGGGNTRNLCLPF